MTIEREPGTLEAEHILLPGAESAAWWRSVPISEPERPTRRAWAILGVTVLFVVAGGSYFWFGEQRRAPAAAQVVPQVNAAPATQPLAVGLAALSSQQQPDKPATAAAPSAPAAPDESPKFATGLHPIAKPVVPNTPPPAADAAPAQPLSTPRPQPRPVRKAAPPSAAPGVPSLSSGLVKF